MHYGSALRLDGDAPLFQTQHLAPGAGAHKYYDDENFVGGVLKVGGVGKKAPSAAAAPPPYRERPGSSGSGGGSNRRRPTPNQRPKSAAAARSNLDSRAGGREGTSGSNEGVKMVARGGDGLRASIERFSPPTSPKLNSPFGENYGPWG